MCYLLKKILILMFLVLVAGLTRVKKKPRAHKNSLRIIGGTDAPNSKYPYIARLELWFDKGKLHREMHSCTCSILTPEWTLTATHCLKTYPKNIRRFLRRMLRYGSDDPSVNASTAEVLKLIPHPAYRSDSFLEVGIVSKSNDIGLIKTSPINIPKYGRISAVDFLSLSGEKALAFGFGMTNASVKGVNVIATTLDLHKPLQALDVMIRRCPQDDKSLTSLFITPGICLSHRCGVSATVCPGDSGGPLLHESGIIGVHSIGEGPDCAFIADRLRSKIVAYITAVSPFLEWIGSTINEK